jgi:hypothetical protein
MTPCDPIIAASFAYHFPVLALFPGKKFCEFLSESGLPEFKDGQDWRVCVVLKKVDTFSAKS